MANLLTALRMICALPILLAPAFSARYYLFYLLGGLTDALDGPVARKLGTAAERGAKFDTAADIVFFLAVLLKLMTSLVIPLRLLIWMGMIAAVKALNLILCFLLHCRLAALHSRFNQVCGVVVFVIPLLLGGAYAWQIKALAVIFGCITASIAAIMECGYILRHGPARADAGSGETASL